LTREVAKSLRVVDDDPRIEILKATAQEGMSILLILMIGGLARSNP
jgi:hypothetical protein